MGALTALPRIGAAIAENLRFFTRLPLGAAVRAPDFAEIGWAAPLAGACIGALAAVVLVVARNVGLPGLVSATLAICVQVALTGALHEDGLADVADGFGGGRDREAKLAIMRDSRLGTYGAAVLMLLRVEAVAALLRPSPAFAAAGLVLSAAAARAAALGPLSLLAPARADGAGARAGALPASALRGAALTLTALAVLLGAWRLEIVRALFACVLAAGATGFVVRLARRQIGGQTGDVCGAAAALAEGVTLLALLIGGRDA
jgi:adenosylcobinamide-GDP ribazoletransferase